MAHIPVERRAAVPRWRINVLLLVVVLASLITSRQLVVVQVLGEYRGKELNALAEKELAKHVVLQPRRGTIRDRNGVALAMNVNKPSLYVDPSEVTDPGKLAVLLGEQIDEEPATLLPILSNTSLQWARLKAWLEPAAAQQVEQIKNNWKENCSDQCLFLVDEAKREYPQGVFASRVVGVANYAGVGVTGVEQFYDTQIRGVTGTLRAEQDANQNPIAIVPQQIVEPKDGQDVTLTIDSAIQKMVEDELARIMAERDPQGATILVMDPNTGEVLALASAPSFDPNNFTAYSLEQINNNDALTAVYEPGSTFKAIITAIGLQTGAFTPTTTVSDTGRVERGGSRISNWNGKANGLLTPAQMLYYSSNVAALQFGELIGPSNFYDYVKLFGYGQPTGIDLNGEQTGIVKWPDGTAWTPTDLSTNSFGQGIAVTPLQHLSAYSALANGGLLMQPHVVKEVCDGDICTPTASRVIRRVLDQAVTDQLRPMMLHNTERYAGAMWWRYSGRSGDQPLVPGYHTGAKTCTSQIADASGGYLGGNVGIASVAGWAPLEQPRVTILVKIDRPNPKYGFYGSEVAVPSFQRLATQLMRYYRIPPDLSYVNPGQELGGPPLPSPTPSAAPEAVLPTPGGASGD